MNKKRLLVLFVLSGICVSAYADNLDALNDAPVVNAEQFNEPGNLKSVDTDTLSSDMSSTISTENMSAEERLSRLEQQMANQSTYAQQVQNLQHQVQDLQGRLDEANHQIQALRQSGDKTVALNNPTLEKSVPVTPEASKNPAIIKVDATEMPTPPAEQNTTNSNNLLQEQDIYEKANKFIEKRDYPQAIASMKSYIEQFPRGQYAGNAHYWLGELYLLQHKKDNARAEFKMVVDKFSNNAKAQLATKRLREIDVKSHAKH